MAREYARPAPLVDVLVEHIGEAAFLYNCRRRSLVDPARSWEDLRNHDRRMAFHLDALHLGGFPSARLLKETLAVEEDGDPGEPFVAGAVFPMLDFIEPMQWLTEALCRKPPHFVAIVDGLKRTKGRNLDGWLEYYLAHENPVVRAVGAEVVGYRQTNGLKDRLIALRDDPEPRVSMSAIRSLAGMGSVPRIDEIVPFLDLADPVLTLDALELLLVIGDRESLSICRETCVTAGSRTNKTLVFLLAVAGTSGDMQLIADVMARQPEITRECLLALGLCGHPDAVDPLIARLGDIESPESHEAAYQGLRILTGMDFLPVFDFDDAGPVEVAGYQRLWAEWWGEHRNAFSKESKWRRGEKISPVVLHKDLLRPGNPRRDMTSLELAIRYACPVGFRPDDDFDVQIRKLEEIGQWATRENGKHQPGVPCVHGTPLS